MYCDNSVRYVAFMGTPCPGGCGPIGSCLKGSFPLYCLLLLFFLLHVAHILLTFVSLYMALRAAVYGDFSSWNYRIVVFFLEGGVFILFSFIKIDTSLESKEQNCGFLFPELLLLFTCLMFMIVMTLFDKQREMKAVHCEWLRAQADVSICFWECC